LGSTSFLLGEQDLHVDRFLLGKQFSFASPFIIVEAAIHKTMRDS
jgi:hypothetical protein